MKYPKKLWLVFPEGDFLTEQIAFKSKKAAKAEQARIKYSWNASAKVVKYVRA